MPKSGVIKKIEIKKSSKKVVVKKSTNKTSTLSAEVESRPTRDGFGNALVKLGEKNPNVIVLCADLKESTRCQAFSEKYPKRFFEMGVAEQNMAAVAAGMGIAGKIPFIASYATFCPGRNWEQIRTTIAYNNSNVKIAGHHAGISTGPDGATHQAIEDIASMRAMPNMKVIVPCDAIEAEKATIAATQIAGPVYLRFAREKSPILTSESTAFIPGKAYELFESKLKPQVAIIGTGPLLSEALIAAKKLEEEKIGTIVLNCHTIKPIDEKKIIEIAKKCGAIVTVEEHNVLGGLGSAVSEVLAKHLPTPIEFIGMQDKFGESGQPHELIKKYGMNSESIIKAVKKVIKRKK